jgi:hypothetical protein
MVLRKTSSIVRIGRLTLSGRDCGSGSRSLAAGGSSDRGGGGGGSRSLAAGRGSDKSGCGGPDKSGGGGIHSLAAGGSCDNGVGGGNVTGTGGCSLC